jgi:hypothetical protein
MGGAPNALGADLLSGRSGSIARGSASQPRTQALLNAMLASGGTNMGGVTARGGGFAGGGFGDLGKFKPPTAEAGGGAPVGGGGGRAPGGGLSDLISKLPGLLPGGLPNLPGMPSPGKPGVGAKPGVPGIPTIPPSLKPPVATKPKLPPINPNIPGGGLVDRLPGLPTPPRVTPPPVNFNRGQDPRFNTPIAQVPNQPPPGNTGITGGMNPTPAPAPPPEVVPIGTQGPNGPIYTGPPASGGAPPAYGGASGTTFKPMPPGMGPGVPGYGTWYAAGYR